MVVGGGGSYGGVGGHAMISDVGLGVTSWHHSVPLCFIV